ncbi:hypothetical protein F4805DRAFT_438165 [Annulohypoxylon moriforme]|nr:hypothetical protein F4805DRAFT_438165 [Annulohypoxylon moriforme]
MIVFTYYGSWSWLTLFCFRKTRCLSIVWPTEAMTMSNQVFRRSPTLEKLIKKKKKGSFFQPGFGKAKESVQ